MRHWLLSPARQAQLLDEPTLDGRGSGKIQELLRVAQVRRALHDCPAKYIVEAVCPLYAEVAMTACVSRTISGDGALVINKHVARAEDLPGSASVSHQTI